MQDLEPSQLVLFIQSFGIPVASMTKLLSALDVAVTTNDEAVAAAVLDKSHKTYMAQLVEVSSLIMLPNGFFSFVSRYIHVSRLDECLGFHFDVCEAGGQG